jgi:hypothetical protein
LQRDLDWLPPSFQALRWTNIAVGLAATIGVNLLPLPPSVLAFGASLPMFAMAGTHHATTWFLRRRVKKLARGEVEPPRLKPDEQLVHLTGHVRARATIPSLLDGRPSVYRRVIWYARGWNGGQPMVHEMAVDFVLADDHGELVHIDVSGARLITAQPKYQKLHGGPAFERIRALPSPYEIDKRRTQTAKRIAVVETLLADGDRVDLLGYKSHTVDATMERLPREAPLRATVRSGFQFPLLLVRAPTE